MAPSDMDNLVTIKTFPSEVEAHLAKAKLASAGIASVVFKDDCGGWGPQMQLTRGVELKVIQSDGTHALDIIDSLKTNGRQSRELKPGENKAVVYSLIAPVFGVPGCCLVLAGLSWSKVAVTIGIALVCIGFIFAIKSKRIKNRIESKSRFFKG